jgi:hypothetical protein
MTVESPVAAAPKGDGLQIKSPIEPGLNTTHDDNIQSPNGEMKGSLAGDHNAGVNGGGDILSLLRQEILALSKKVKSMEEVLELK